MGRGEQHRRGRAPVALALVAIAALTLLSGTASAEGDDVALDVPDPPAASEVDGELLAERKVVRADGEEAPAERVDAATPARDAGTSTPSSGGGPAEAVVPRVEPAVATPAPTPPPAVDASEDGGPVVDDETAVAGDGDGVAAGGGVVASSLDERREKLRQASALAGLTNASPVPPIEEAASLEEDATPRSTEFRPVRLVDVPGELSEPVMADAGPAQPQASIASPEGPATGLSLAMVPTPARGKGFVSGPLAILVDDRSDVGAGDASRRLAGGSPVRAAEAGGPTSSALHDRLSASTSWGETASARSTSMISTGAASPGSPTEPSASSFTSPALSTSTAALLVLLGAFGLVQWRLVPPRSRGGKVQAEPGRLRTNTVLGAVSGAGPPGGLQPVTDTYPFPVESERQATSAATTEATGSTTSTMIDTAGESRDGFGGSPSSVGSIQAHGAARTGAVPAPPTGSPLGGGPVLDLVAARPASHPPVPPVTAGWAFGSLPAPVPPGSLRDADAPRARPFESFAFVGNHPVRERGPPPAGTSRDPPPESLGM